MANLVVVMSKGILITIVVAIFVVFVYLFGMSQRPERGEHIRTCYTQFPLAAQYWNLKVHITPSNTAISSIFYWGCFVQYFVMLVTFASGHLHEWEGTILENPLL